MRNQAGDLSAIGFVGDMDRVEAEAILSHYDVGFFLVRYSKKSFVLSYVDSTPNSRRSSGLQVLHVGQILPIGEQGMLEVLTESKDSVRYPNLVAYCERMRQIGHITEPIQVDHEEHR